MAMGLSQWLPPHHAPEALAGRNLNARLGHNPADCVACAHLQVFDTWSGLNDHATIYHGAYYSARGNRFVPIPGVDIRGRQEKVKAGQVFIGTRPPLHLQGLLRPRPGTLRRECSHRRVCRTWSAPDLGRFSWVRRHHELWCCHCTTPGIPKLAGRRHGRSSRGSYPLAPPAGTCSAGGTEEHG